MKRIKRMVQLTDTEDEIEECHMSAVLKNQKVTAKSGTSVEKKIRKGRKKDGTCKK